MTRLLITSGIFEQYEDEIRAIEQETGTRLEPVLLPGDPDARLPDDEAKRIELAYFSGDVPPTRSRSFLSAVRRSERLRWMHISWAGADHPVFGAIVENGAKLTTSAGASAEPIAQTAIAGMLMLARGFRPHFEEAQRRHAWEDLPEEPRDLVEQEMTIIGLGSIGNAIGRIAQAIGLTVIGVRRSPRRDDDNVDRLITPGELPVRLPETDWLVIACPLTDDTRGLVSREMLESLPRGARIINVARGEIVDEAAMLKLLQSGHLGGAYLDVFNQEPLPADSPFWDLPNVIVTPHASSPSQGNAGRANRMFLDNLRRWAKGEPLVNEALR